MLSLWILLEYGNNPGIPEVEDARKRVGGLKESVDNCLVGQI